MSLELNLTSSLPVISCRARHSLGLFLLGLATGALLTVGVGLWWLAA